jgi:hypothetical protein
MKDYSIHSDEMVTRILSPYIGLETTVDKILFSIATSLTLILFIILLRFWRRRKQIVHNIDEKGADRNIKQLEQAVDLPVEPLEYPTITFVAKSRTGSKGSIESEISSMWDSQSQKFDNIFFKDTGIQIEIETNMSDTDRDIEIGCTTTELETAERGILETDLSSTVDRVGAGVDDMKLKTWSLRRYEENKSKDDDNIIAVESRDDMMYEARSV